MGLPVARLIAGSNRNDILARFLTANDMSIAEVQPSLSPSMDIQVSSNFERLLFELLERDAGATEGAMAGFRRTGKMAVPGAAWRRCRTVFHGFSLDDAGTEQVIARLHEASGYLADPHTAIGIAAAQANPPGHGVATIAMATAHPAKFPEIGRACHRDTSCGAGAPGRTVRPAGALHCAAERPRCRGGPGPCAGPAQRMKIPMLHIGFQ